MALKILVERKHPAMDFFLGARKEMSVFFGGGIFFELPLALLVQVVEQDGGGLVEGEDDRGQDEPIDIEVRDKEQQKGHQPAD
jgi:hypothetical protein